LPFARAAAPLCQLELGAALSTSVKIDRNGHHWWRPKGPQSPTCGGRVSKISIKLTIPVRQLEAQVRSLKDENELLYGKLTDL
jgi:hypothetical protein